MNKNKKIFTLIFLLIFALPPQAEEVTLIVEGIGDSKANAIIDAQRNALRTSYGEFVSTNLTTLNNQLTKNENVNLVSGTVKDFKVISESENDFAIPPIVEVLMSVTVNKGKLVSFAKAIGDNVEIQGSLFGAEIRQQEINKNNEVIAMDHLAKKAETMSAFFDYEISVESPKRSPLIEEDYYIYSSLSLKTNNNYANLMNTVIDTLFEVAMKPEEREKYDELGTPYYALYLWAFERYFTRGESERKDRGKTGGACARSAGSLNFLRKAADCVKGEMQIVYLRSKESFLAFHSIRKQIERSVVGYEVSRKTRSDSKLLFPFPFAVTRNDSGLRGNPFEELHYHDVDNPRVSPAGTGGIDPDNTKLIDRVLERQPEENKRRLSDECPDSYDGPMHLCYEEVIWTDYVDDVIRMYGWDGSKYTIRIATFEPGGFFSDATLNPLGSNEDQMQSTCSSRLAHESKYYRDNPGIIKNECTRGYQISALESLTYPVFAYSKVYPCSNCTFEGLKRFGVLLIFPNDFEFSVLKFEDLVTKELLPTITAYTVDPDKPTKR